MNASTSKSKENVCLDLIELDLIEQGLRSLYDNTSSTSLIFKLSIAVEIDVIKSTRNTKAKAKIVNIPSNHHLPKNASFHALILLLSHFIRLSNLLLLLSLHISHSSNNSSPNQTIPHVPNPITHAAPNPIATVGYSPIAIDESPLQRLWLLRLLQRLPAK